MLLRLVKKVADGFLGCLLVISLLVIWLPIFVAGHLRKLRGAAPRVLFGPTSSINFVGYVRALRPHGIEAAICVYSPDQTISPADCDFVLGELAGNALSRLVLPYVSFVYFLCRYDLFCRYFNVDGLLASTPLRYVELPILKSFGKRVVCLPYGSDVQREHKMPLALRRFYADPERDRLVVKNVTHSAKWCDFKLTGGDLFAHMPYDLCYPCLAVDTDEVTPAYPERDNAHVLRIVHGTNHPELKGSKAIEGACALLAEKGHPIEYVFVSGLRNEVAQRIYRSADIIVDQLLVGAYGMFAVEAMALGKPVICHITEDVRRANLCYAELPLVDATPATICERLKVLIEDPDLRYSLGISSRKYVERYHSLPAIGSLLHQIFWHVWLRTDSSIREGIVTSV